MSKKTDDADAAKLQQIRDRFDEAFRKWETIYKEGDLNMRYIAGDPWDPMDKQARKDAGRPCMAPDELGQYLNQAVNEVRANPRSAKFSPTGDGANDETSRFYADLMRETEYRSNAQIAYTTAYENALQRGFGFVRLRADYEHERSPYQQLTIEAVANPACCYPDPDAMRPDGSDWQYFFYVESYSKDEFKRAFPKAEFTSFSQEQIAQAGSSWISEGKVQVSEYWEVETEMHQLVQVETPATRTVPKGVATYIEGIDPKPRGSREIQRRPTEVRSVSMYLTNGVELLKQPDGEKKKQWAGKYIPFAGCYGKIIWMNAGSGPERRVLAMTSLAREPYMAYCFAFTSQLETIGTITKNPYMGYRGSATADQLNEVAKSLHEPVAMLQFEPFLNGAPGQLIPLPVRNPMSVDLSAYAMVTENCRRAIQAAMGWTPLPSSAQRRNEKSGVALKQIEESGQRGSYHFIDHYNDMIRFIGVQFEDLVDKLYDTQREVITIGVDQTTQKVQINQPQPPSRISQGANDILASVKGRHAVTVDVGPEFQSERDAADALVDTLIGSPIVGMLEPPKRDKILALSIKARNIGIMGDKIADVISPPENQDADTEQLKGLLKQAQEQIIPQLQQQIQQLEQEKAAKVTEVQGRLAVVAQSDATKERIADKQLAQKEREAELRADTDIRLQEMQDQIDRMSLMVKSTVEGRKMQEHRELEGARLEHSTVMTERGHEQAEMQGELSHRREMERAERNDEREEDEEDYDEREEDEEDYDEREEDEED